MFLRIFKHVMPRAKAWRITIDKKLRQFFQGLTGLGEDARAHIDEVWLDIFPQTTRDLSSWEQQWGLPTTTLTDQERRDRLDGAWKALGGQSPAYLQETLRVAGFDVYVHEWWGMSRVYATACGEPLAIAGDPAAACGDLLSWVDPETPVARDPSEYIASGAIGYLTVCSAPLEPRVLTPSLSLNFEEQVYTQGGNLVTFDDLVTYERGSSATYWNKYLNQSGEWESFLDTEYVGDVENLAHYSEDLTNWTAQGLTVIPNATTNPVDGLMTADHLVESAGMTHQVDSNTITFEPNKTYTASFYVKQTANNRNVSLSITHDISGGNSAVAVFDTSTGEVLSINGYAHAAASTYEGDGWFRVSVTVVFYGYTTAPMPAKLYLADGEDILYSSDSISGVYAFGGQLVQSTKPLPYVATPAAAAATEAFTESPLFEYDPATLEPLGVASYGSYLNILKYSESFKYDSEDELMFWDNHCYAVPHAAVAPDRTMSMRKLSAYNSNGRNVDPYVSYFLSLTTGEQYTFSVFVKAGEVEFAQMSMQDGQRVNFGLVSVEKGEQDAGIDNASIKDCGNGFRRLSCTVTITNTVLFCSIGLTDSLTGVYKPGITWGDGLGFYIWGGMCNEGASAAPYFSKYEEGFLLRYADQFKAFDEGAISGVEDITVVAEFKVDATGDGARTAFTLDVDAPGLSSPEIAIRVNSEGALQFQRGENPISSSVTEYDDYLGSCNTAVLTFSNNGLKGFFNGEAVLDVYDSVNAFSSHAGYVRVGATGGGGSELGGNIKKLEFYDDAMTAAEVAAYSGVEAAGSTALVVCGAATTVCGSADGASGGLLVNKPVNIDYEVPTDPLEWPYVLYIGGETYGEKVRIPLARREEFEALCLKICPAQQWIGLIVEYN